MGGRDGGTMMNCPKCKECRVCAAINPKLTTGQGGQRIFHGDDHADLEWFRRGRECLHCGTCFTTAEVNEHFLYELVRLRNSLSSIKLHANKYQEEAEQAALSLSYLTTALGVLKVLK